MTSLYNLTAELAHIEELMSDPEREAELIALIQHKVDGCAEYVNHIDDYVEAVEKKMAELEKYLTNAKAKRARFVTYLKFAFEQLGVSDLQGNIHHMKFRKPSKILLVKDESLIPGKFKTIEQIVKIDKQAIKKALETEEVPGVELNDGVSSLVIKGRL